jgi:hypothetical protein
MRGKKRNGALNVPRTPIGEHIRKIASAYDGERAEGLLQAASILEAEVKRAGIEPSLLFFPKAGAAVAGDDQVGRIEHLVGRLEELVADVVAVVKDAPRAPRELPPILQDVAAGAPRVRKIEPAERVAPGVRRVAEVEDGTGASAYELVDEGGRGERELLAAIAAASIAGHDEATQRWLCVLTGYKPRTCSTYVSRLRAKGYVEPGRLVTTKEGLAWLGDYARPPRGAALVDWWRRRLGTGGERELFDRLVKVYPNALAHADLLEIGTMKARTVSTYLSRLIRRKIIAKSGRAYRAADELGLRAS